MKKKNAIPSLFQAAADAWPEDEAGLTFSTFHGRMTEPGNDEADKTYFRELLAKDVAHMQKVFSTESDAAELVARYRAELARLLAADDATKGESLPV